MMSPKMHRFGMFEPKAHQLKRARGCLWWPLRYASISEPSVINVLFSALQLWPVLTRNIQNLIPRVMDKLALPSSNKPWFEPLGSSLIIALF